MPFPIWAAGQRVTAGGLTLMEPLVAQKQVDQLVTASTVLVNDLELLLNVNANALYTLDSWLMFTATAGADIKIGWTFPAGSTMLWAAGGTGTVNFTDNDQSIVAGTTARGARGNGSTPQAMPARGYLKTSSTAGQLRLQFAQSVSNAAATTMKAGAWLRLQQFA